MKKTTKLLSLLCAVAAVIMMIPMQLAVVAEDPAAGTVYDLYSGFGTGAEYDNYSFYVAPNGQSDMMVDGKADFTKLIRLPNVKVLGGWPSGTYYLSDAESGKTTAEPSIEHFYTTNNQICTTVRQGYCNTIVFTAPTCGTYTYTAVIHTWDNGKNMEMSVKKPGAWEWGKAANVAGSNANVTATDTVSLKKGETICFYFRNTDGDASDIRVTIESFKVSMDKVTHKAGEAKQENYVAATCADGGYDTVVRCTECNEIISSEHTVLPKVADKHKGPELTRNVNVVPATCQTEGSHDVETYCEYCNTVIKTEPVTDPKLTDHTPEAGDPVKENEVAATCHSEGSYDLVTRCKTCGGVMATEHKTTKKTDHTPGAAVRENENLPTVVGKAGSYDEVVYCSVPECKAEISRKTVKVYLKKVNYTLKNFGKTTNFSSNNLSLMFTTAGNGTDIGGAVGKFADTLKPLNKLTDVGGGKRYTLGGNDKFKHAELVDGEMRIYAENGGFNVIVFTAPEDGTYTYEFSGHNAWGNDIELAVNINGNSSTWGKSVNGAFGSTGKASDTVNLKKGEKIFFVPRLTAGADQAGQHDYFVLESFSVSTVRYVEKQPVNPGTGTYIAASVFACAAAAVVCTVAAKKKKSI